MQAPLLNDAVAAREASMYKKPREKPTESAADNLTTMQKLAWNAHDKIFGMAADIGAQKANNPVPDKMYGMAADIGVQKANNPIPATEEAFFSKAKQREALAAEVERAKQGSGKNARDTERAKMLADIKAKARKNNVKKQPSFEVMDVPEHERDKGEQIRAYQERKAEEHRQKMAQEEAKYKPSPKVVEVDYVESFKSKQSEKQAASEKNDDEDDRDDPFDSDVTSEEDSDDMMPERATETTEDIEAANLIRQELEAQERENEALINEELKMSGQDVLAEADKGYNNEAPQYDEFDGAYQMYQELLDVVRSGDDQEDISTDATVIEQSMNMPAIAEESETEYPSFTSKPEQRGRAKRQDSEFDKVIDSVLADIQIP